MTPEDTFKERFYEATGATCDRDVRKWCREHEVSANEIRQFLEVQSIPRATTLMAIADALNTSVDWLLGRDYAHLMTNAQLQALANTARETLGRDAKLEYVPVLDLKASAGKGIDSDYEGSTRYWLAFNKDWISDHLGHSKHDLVVMKAEGNSMEDTFSDGDVLLVNLLNKEPQNICVIWHGGVRKVKRLQYRADGVIKVISDNTTYDPEYVYPSDPNSDFRVIGRVVWASRTFN